MIVKNEAHIIQRCLRSVRPYIDYYSISDTGSTDGTMDVIRKELAGIPGVLKSDPWEGFGPNRNITRDRAVGTHILSIDADEVLVHKGGSLVLNPEYDGFWMQVAYTKLSVWLLRITRNDPRWRWYYKLHNALLFEGVNKETRIENFTIKAFNDSNQNIRGNKFLRHVEIYESEPATPRNVFYHAQALWGLDRFEEAIVKYNERIAMGGWEEEVYYSLFKVGDMMYRAGRPCDEVTSALFRAYAYRPTRYEALALMCQVLRENSKWDMIYSLTMIEPKPNNTDILSVEKDSEWLILEEHAIAAFNLGKIDEAREYFLRAAQFELPDDARERIKRNIGACMHHLTNMPHSPKFQTTWS
jgi:glycosyltransferase involved in cell wall biosynthesis